MTEILVQLGASFGALFAAAPVQIGARLIVVSDPSRVGRRRDLDLLRWPEPDDRPPRAMSRRRGGDRRHTSSGAPRLEPLPSPPTAVDRAGGGPEAPQRVGPRSGGAEEADVSRLPAGDGRRLADLPVLFDRDRPAMSALRGRRRSLLDHLRVLRIDLWLEDPVVAPVAEPQVLRPASPPGPSDPSDTARLTSAPTSPPAPLEGASSSATGQAGLTGANLETRPGSRRGCRMTAPRLGKAGPR